MKNIGIAVGGGKAFAVNPLLLLVGIAIIFMIVAQATSTNQQVY